MKSGSLNLLETLGPVQAYTGIALPLPLLISVLLNNSKERVKKGTTWKKKDKESRQK
jgi:hypothetical protein